MSEQQTTRPGLTFADEELMAKAGWPQEIRDLVQRLSNQIKTRTAERNSVEAAAKEVSAKLEGRSHPHDEAWMKVAVESNKALDAYLRSVDPDLPEHYGMPTDGVRLVVERLRGFVGCLIARIDGDGGHRAAEDESLKWSVARADQELAFKKSVLEERADYLAQRLARLLRRCGLHTCTLGDFLASDLRRCEACETDVGCAPVESVFHRLARHETVVGVAEVESLKKEVTSLTQERDELAWANQNLARQRDQAVREAARRDEKWKTGVREACGADIEFGDRVDPTGVNVLTLDRFVRQLKDAKDQAYEERNRVVAALARLFPSGVARTAIEGWDPEWHGCVWLDLPTGQASWHYHDSQAYLFEGLRPYRKGWDGHTTEQKYERLAALHQEFEFLVKWQRHLRTEQAPDVV